MAYRILDTFCETCEHVYHDQWIDGDGYPVCCGQKTRMRPHVLKTTEWGGPRQYLHLRDEPFSSRGELESWAKKNHLGLGESSEKVGGARNEDHLNLGKVFSIPQKTNARSVKSTS